MSVQDEVLYIPVFRKISSFAGILVIVIGGLAMAGWVLDIPSLKSVFPGLVSMKTNTALCFLLGGVGTCLLAGGGLNRVVRSPGQCCAGLLLLVGLLTLLQYVFGLDIGIDQMIFKEAAGAFGTLSPNRMAPTTAFNFSILGFAMLVFWRSELRGFVVAQVLTLIASLMGFLTLMGYAYGVREFLGIGRYTQMALHTAVAFMLLGAGVLFSRPDRGIMALVNDGNIGGTVARRLLPFSIAIPFLLGWLLVRGYEAHLYEHAFGVALFMIAMAVIFSGIILGSVLVLNRTENLLHENEQKYQALYDFSQDAIMTLSPPDWRFTAANPSTLKMFRAKDEPEFLSKGPWDVSPEFQADGQPSAGKALQMIQKAVQDGVHSFEWIHKRLNGETFPAAVLLARMEWKGKALLQATVRDSTAQKASEAELKNKMEELARFNRIAVGRELKMIELKERIKSLEEGRSL